jgi:hypothetical protein
MSRRIESIRRSNHSLFLPQNYGSPFNDTAEHISELGLGRLDFERGAVAGEVIYTVDGDLTPTSQQEEEARIATLAYALKKLGNLEDAAEFMRCLFVVLPRHSPAVFRSSSSRDISRILSQSLTIYPL